MMLNRNLGSAKQSFVTLDEKSKAPKNTVQQKFMGWFVYMI